MSQKNRSRKKIIKIFKWTVKIAFLLILILPIKYFNDNDVYKLPVYSLALGGYSQPPLMKVSYGQTVCSFLLNSWVDLGPGGWVTCPIGGLQILLTAGQCPRQGINIDFLTISLISAVSIFLLSIIILGPIFCSWICPVGTIVDGADKGVERFMPNLNKRREERLRQSLDKNKKKSGSICPTCYFGKFLANKNATVANGVVIAALVGAFILKFPLWCSICPIGILSQGMFHLKSVTRISQLRGFTTVWMPVLIELWIFPVIAVILTFREKRYWCRKICPVGAVVRFFAKFNPFLKIKLKNAKQVAKENAKTGEGASLTYCAECSKMDQRTCEKVCPQGLGPLKAKGSAECTKCLECYAECKQGMIGIKWFSTPDVVLWFRRFFQKLKKRFKK